MDDMGKCFVLVFFGLFVIISLSSNRSRLYVVPVSIFLFPVSIPNYFTISSFFLISSESLNSCKELTVKQINITRTKLSCLLNKCVINV